jgi:uncharacterized membrane protein
LLRRKGRTIDRPAETIRVSTGRLESFSDGVIAVAATLLVLNITVPRLRPHESLIHALLHMWPAYAAYAVSFITIGIIWVNHHAMISRLRIADHAILMLNLLLLLSIALLPFATSLFAAFLRETRGANLAAALYAGAFLGMSLVFAGLNALILLGRPHMLTSPISVERRQQILRRGVTGLIPYAAATALAAVSPYVTLVICAAVAGFYALPIASGLEGAAV